MQISNAHIFKCSPKIPKSLSLLTNGQLQTNPISANGYSANGATTPTTSPYSNGASEAQALLLAEWELQYILQRVGQILHGEVKTKLHHEVNFIMKQTRKCPHLWLQEKSHQISTIHQLPHLILLTNGLQMSLHLFQICLLQLIAHRNAPQKPWKTSLHIFMACGFARLFFTPNHPTLQNAPPNRMITTKTSIQIEREQNT